MTFPAEAFVVFSNKPLEKKFIFLIQSIQWIKRSLLMLSTLFISYGSPKTGLAFLNSLDMCISKKRIRLMHRKHSAMRL